MIKLVINTRESDTLKHPEITLQLFNEVAMNLKYDSVASTFSFKMYFNPDSQQDAEVACVSHYHECRLYYEHEEGNPAKDELLITGYMLSQSFTDSEKIELVPIGGYSKAGVIEDCDIPTNIPLESIGLTFRQVVEKVLKPFGGKKGIKFRVVASNADTKFTEDQKKVDTTIEKTTAPESKNIKSYLAELATKKNLVLSHDAHGDLLVTRANTNGPVFLDLDADKNPMVGYKSMNMTYNGQPMHSHITVIRQADQDGGNAGEVTIRNPFCPIVFRPRVITMTADQDVTIQDTAENELGKELKNIVLTIVMNKASYNNKFINRNNIITVKNRRCYCYTKQKWFIESVDYKKDQAEEEVTLTCVVPYVYNYHTKNVDGTFGPKNYFVDTKHNFPRV